MFDTSADFYDALYSFKNYEQEALSIRDYIYNRNPNARTILDVACGTGKHIEYLNAYYSADGIDLNDKFIHIAQNRNPNSSFWCKDMTSFDLNKKYDVVMCLFSSIAYVKTLDLVKQTVEQFKKHISEGGFIIIEPWFSADTWRPGYVTILSHETEDYKISRMSHADQEGNISILNFEYLVGSSEGIQHLKEKHELGLFSHEELLEVFKSTGMAVDYDAQGISGRGLYILRGKNQI